MEPSCILAERNHRGTLGDVGIQRGEKRVTRLIESGHAADDFKLVAVNGRSDHERGRGRVLSLRRCHGGEQERKHENPREERAGHARDLLPFALQPPAFSLRQNTLRDPPLIATAR